ncbi:MAG: cytochrome c family protein [Alphaproteobacteria bacterium]|nr:cytochrome c family protein [Alphaproteobacteria bacterium]
MEDRFNTIAGWTLFAGIVGLGLNTISSHYFSGDKPHRPHKMGYEIEGVEAESGAEESGPPLATLLATGDIAKGEAVYAKCVSCHAINAGGANGIGPNLYGIMGVAIGKHISGFAYSKALKSHGGNWTWENMDAWLKSPKAFASGTKMTFAGLSKPEDRAALMLYLNSQGSNIPLPPPPAAEASPTEGEAVAPDGPIPSADTAKDAGAMAQPATAAQ